MEIGDFEIPTDSAMFLAILAIHVPVGVLALVTGAVRIMPIIGIMLIYSERDPPIPTGRAPDWALGDCHR